MQHPKMRVRICAIVAMVGLAALALPLSADARVRVSVGIGVPVYPAPVVVAPRRGWYTPRPWLWCGLPWSRSRHRWCTVVPG